MGKNNKEFAPAKTPKDKFNQLISLSFDAAEAKLRDGSASSQLICLLLQCASEKHNLEIQKLESDISVANAKIEQMESEAEDNKKYLKAINAFKSYQGYDDGEDDDEEDYEEDDEYYD